jgi:predicted DNA-binding transcriptional regulator AlpA
MVNEHSEYIPATVVQARYAISDVTLWRWIRSTSLGFPQPVVVNRRRFFRRAELEAWECTRVRSAPSRAAGSAPRQGEAA